MVEAQGIHKHFGANHVLRGVDLTVRKGEVVVIVGPSGSGKSTFLRCLNHLDAPDQGWVRIDGDLLGYRSEQRRHGARCPIRGTVAAAPPHRHGVPAVQPVQPHDRAGERHVGSAAGDAG